jgi:hypothetical protein
VALLAGLLAVYMLSGATSTGVMYLSGKGTDDAVLWDFYCTAGQNSGKWAQIPVPSNWEFHGFGQFNYGHDRDGDRLNESGLYRHTFTVPAAWKGRKVNIVFDGSMTDTEVQINGRSAGVVHRGAFYRFRYDISALLKYGKENLLEVTVHKASGNPTVEAAERRADFWIFGGIFRPVWLEALPQEHIERIAIDARADGQFRMDVHLGKAVTGAEIVAQLTTMDGRPYGQPVRRQVEKSDSLRLSATFAAPALWSSEFPNRYRVEVALLKDGRTLHAVVEKFGFRTAELRPGDGFYVNGAKIRFKGVDRHTHWPTSGRASSYAVSLNDAELIREMNMNAVRMSHYPPDAHFLEVCDSLGLYVIDELTAWQYPPYETAVGRTLVRELILRDVNHPCVVMWANGNEGGFNFELLPEYARYDVQQRRVIHPWLEEAEVNTNHYISYDAGARFYFEGNKVFFPTEFLHGQYDGGHGAGLDDYWNRMLSHPLAAGGFLWDFADQGVVRNDRDGRMDTDGDHAADGILGPYREKEGSFYTIREIWSPVYLEGMHFLPPSFDGKIGVQNRYHFTNLNQCSFSAQWVKFDYVSNATSAVTAKVNAPDVAPGFSGVLEIEMPASLAGCDALRLTATDPHGKEIYTWTRTVTPAARHATRVVARDGNRAEVSETADEISYRAGNTVIVIDKRRGVLSRIEVDGKTLPLNNGPRFTNPALALAEIKTVDADGQPVTECLFARNSGEREKSRNRIRLSLLPSGWIEVDYAYDVRGANDLIGVTFDFPEQAITRARWLGNGPSRVWKNRLKGVTFGLWEKAYNNTVTGESWDYPEFKGFHSNLYAADLSTNYGLLRIVAASEDLFLHLLTPDKPAGRTNDHTIAPFPDGALSILSAISPVGTKFKSAAELGPQSQPNTVFSSSHTDPISGKFYLKFEPR